MAGFAKVAFFFQPELSLEPHGDNCMGNRVTHQGDCLTKQKDLQVVTRLCQRVTMQEWESCLGRII